MPTTVQKLMQVAKAVNARRAAVAQAKLAKRPDSRSVPPRHP